ncbi:sensor histidine kinase, partial [Saccharomonospora saliphila]|uniref:sensor histidine kinase n=1 Tax=Saccharomonospora saliphila TaxID=369829 RepID=UPI00037D28A5
DRASEAGARISAPREAVRDRLGGLPGLREEILSGQTGPVEAVTAYTGLTRALLDLHTAVAAGIGAEEFGATADAVHDLLVARDEVGVHQALIGHGIALGLAPSDYNDIRNAEVRRADRVAEFTATATASQRALFDSTVRGPEFDEYLRVVDAVLAGEDAERDVFGSLTPAQWSATAEAVSGAVGQVAGALGGQVTDRAHAEAESATTAAVVLAAVLAAALVLTAVVVFAITRQLLRSLRVLRGSALDVAHSDLPEAVRRIQDGDAVEGEITPVPVHTRDEVGQVARAFDAVHEEALRLASEQAGLRTGYAGMFVNLSRRSQSLVQRQLQLIERLERDEEDADQLATLFQLDHLATRMRRNNENLMVLSGAEPGRRSGQPVSVTDVLRAAVSEIEQYQRVRVRTSPALGVVGYAAGDLIRLVAELLDNATAFSAPETTVTVVSAARDDGGLTVEILDEGIGMNEAEVLEANERIGEAGTADMTTSRRMGLFVVGRLATRHGFGVTLHGGKDIVGVRATVTVPAETVTEHTGRPEPERPAPGSGAGKDLPDAGSAAANGQSVRSSLTPDGAPLPRRTPAGEEPEERTEERHAVPEPTDSEMSGTALFTPLDREETREPGHAASPGPHAPGGRAAPGRRFPAVP